MSERYLIRDGSIKQEFTLREFHSKALSFEMRGSHAVLRPCIVLIEEALNKYAGLSSHP
jgi:hypothetical protein